MWVMFEKHIFKKAINDKEFMQEIKDNLKSQYVEMSIKFPTKNIDEDIYVSTTISLYSGWLIWKWHFNLLEFMYE